MDAYITVTAHWITDDFRMEYAVVGTPSVPGTHDAETTAGEVRDLLTSFRLNTDACSGSITDNAGNISNAADYLDVDSINCFCHTLQLALNKGMKVSAIDRMLGAVKKLVLHFNKSSKCTMELKKRQEHTPGRRALKLVGYNNTRWNSVYAMCERLLKLQWEVRAILGDERFVKRSVARNLELTTTHWDLMQRLVDLLQPFKDLTVAMQASTYPTASLVYPSLVDAENLLQRDEAGEPPSMREVKATILFKIQEEFFFENWHLSKLVKCSTLDPRYKRLKFLTSHSRSEAVEEGRKLFKQLYRQQELKKLSAAESERAAVNSEQDRALPDAEGSRQRRTLFGQRFAGAGSSPEQGESSNPPPSLSREQTWDRKVDSQYDAFVLEEPLPSDADPLEWWRQNYSRFDSLVPAVKQLFCIPASSAPAESIFSTSGHVVRKKRASLLPENADMFVFMNVNKRFYDPTATHTDEEITTVAE